MSDLMPDDSRRRWEDIRVEIRAAVADAMTPLRLTTDRLDMDVRQLKTTVYGDPALRIRGLVERLEGIESKLDTLIDQSEARLNQWTGIKTALIIIGTVSSLPTLQLIGKALGVLP